MFISPFMGTLEGRLNEQLTPVFQPPPAVEKPSGNTNHSIETLVVVLAVITILAVIAGILARLCGGRHFGGNGEHDIEGWVESRCRSCIDGGVPAAPPPPAEPKPKPKPAEPAEEAKPPAEEAKK
ncbi:FISSION REGULATOR-LIKE PROTEIN [Salix viminalis]|uniref:FISSION REGULATOR-LIKE PROTEIN n=1 Tax=Salix viminalis TaxID=40686 RepID=A0A9Q0V650_SALVM|nr:FISSION REGULATOR-LIKE PROTEIN [Salix viminalis]